MTGGQSGGMSGTGMNGGRTEQAPTQNIINDFVKIKCFYAKDLTPTGIKGVLDRIKGVSEVKIDDREHTISFKYQGKMKDLATLEATCSNSGIPSTLVTHARIILVFKSQKGADINKLKAAMQQLGGVKAADIGSTAGELYADLTMFSFEDLAKAAEGAGYKAECKTHEAVDLAVKGDKHDDLGKSLNSTRGVITCRMESWNNKAILVTLKKISDDSFKKIVEKAGMTIDSITRR